MDAAAVRRLLEQVRAGELDVAEAEARLRAVPPYAELGDFATIDHHRGLRQGHPEIVFAPGKTPPQVVAIAREILARSGRLLVTRTDTAQAAALTETIEACEHDAIARTVAVLPQAERRTGVAIVSAGTADQTAAREARATCLYLGEEPDFITDVGVAGVHRLLRHQERLQGARVVIVVAGMEGALASVVGGLVGVPVIALPTSVGYGTGHGGLAALLSMLNSCAANVTCVNIDNGVGAAVVASLINK
jgi:NCAIR mutase (PurE)-related protein